MKMHPIFRLPTPSEAHHIFNPWWGCAKVSAGCDNCSAAERAKKLYDGNIWGEDAPRRFLSHDSWDKPIIWNQEAAAKHNFRRVLCADMADVFEPRPDLAPHRQRLLTLIGATKHLDWLLLTKRPEAIKGLLPLGYRFPSNVWIGASVEDQRTLDERVRYLQAFTTAGVRFLHCEPLLGPLDISRYLKPGKNGVRINWVVCGGEQGRYGRPMDPEWVESLLDQCQAAGVPFLFKQWGTWAPADQVTFKGSKNADDAKVAALMRSDGTTVELVKTTGNYVDRYVRKAKWNSFPMLHHDDIFY